MKREHSRTGVMNAMHRIWIYPTQGDSFAHWLGQCLNSMANMASRTLFLQLSLPVQPSLETTVFLSTKTSRQVKIKSCHSGNSFVYKVTVILYFSLLSVWLIVQLSKSNFISIISKLVGDTLWYPPRLTRSTIIKQFVESTAVQIRYE